MTSTAKRSEQAGKFVAEHRAGLLALARNLCRNQSDAEDLVQETSLRFIVTFEKLEALPAERTCQAWMVTTLTHLFYDQCRRRKVQAQSAQDPLLSNEAVVEPESAQPPVYDSISDEQFAKAVHSLSPKIRATFEMHAAGQKYQDISRSLGIPVGTVAKRLHDARAKLRALLQPKTESGVH